MRAAAPSTDPSGARRAGTRRARTQPRETRRADRGLGRLSVVAGGVLAVLLAAMAWTAVEVATRQDPSAEPGPVEALVDAFARSRWATFRATGTFERTNDAGARLESPVEVVQRPPDRLRRQFGEISGRRDDRPLVCPAPAAPEQDGDAAGAADADGEAGAGALRCGLGPVGSAFDELVAEEVASFRALVEGEQPLYQVRPAGDGCWRMTRDRFDPRAGFGVESVLCFDAATGAPREQRTDHGDVDEVTTFDVIAADVDDRDLEP